MNKIIDLLKKLFRVKKVYRNSRADMCLPDWVALVGLCTFVIGFIFFIVAIALSSGFAVFLTVLFWLSSVCAFLVWRNHLAVFSRDGNSVQYTTVFGKKKVHNFNELAGVKVHKFHMTVYYGDEKVYVFTCDEMTDRFVGYIASALEFSGISLG